MLLLFLHWREAGEERPESDLTHVARHGLSKDDVEEAAHDMMRRGSAWPDVDGRIIGIGLTARGTALKIILKPWRDEKGAFCPVTAFKAGAREEAMHLRPEPKRRRRRRK